MLDVGYSEYQLGPSLGVYATTSRVIFIIRYTDMPSTPLCTYRVIIIMHMDRRYLRIFHAHTHTILTAAKTSSRKIHAQIPYNVRRHHFLSTRAICCHCTTATASQHGQGQQGAVAACECGGGKGSRASTHASIESASVGWTVRCAIIHGRSYVNVLPPSTRLPLVLHTPTN